MRVLIADDHDLIRDGVKPFLEVLDDHVEISEAGNLPEALDSAGREPRPDLVLLDLKMPGMNGLQGIEKMVAMAPDARVVVISGFYNRSDILGAIEKGAVGYIPKTMTGKSLVNALKLVLAGEVYLPAKILEAQGQEANGAASGNDGVLSQLTSRERDILGRLIEGRTNKEIGRSLGVQEITVKVHLRNVYKKLGANNRAAAVRIALNSGWSAV